MPSPNPAQAQPKTTNFVSLQDYLNANRPAVQGMVGNLTGAAAQGATQAQNEASAVANSVYGKAKGRGPDAKFDVTAAPGYAQAQADQSSAWGRLQGLTDPGARTDQLQGFYGPNVSALDSQLAGVGGNAQLHATQSRFGGLDNYLQGQANAAQTRGWGDYKAPGTPADVDPTIKDVDDPWGARGAGRGAHIDPRGRPGPGTPTGGVTLGDPYPDTPNTRGHTRGITQHPWNPLGL